MPVVVDVTARGRLGASTYIRCRRYRTDAIKNQRLCQTQRSACWLDVALYTALVSDYFWTISSGACRNRELHELQLKIFFFHRQLEKSSTLRGKKSCSARHELEHIKDFFNENSLFGTKL